MLIWLKFLGFCATVTALLSLVYYCDPGSQMQGVEKSNDALVHIATGVGALGSLPFVVRLAGWTDELNSKGYQG